jgi:hypothetical protein
VGLYIKHTDGTKRSFGIIIIIAIIIIIIIIINIIIIILTELRPS